MKLFLSLLLFVPLHAKASSPVEEYTKRMEQETQKLRHWKAKEMGQCKDAVSSCYLAFLRDLRPVTSAGLTTAMLVSKEVISQERNSKDCEASCRETLAFKSYEHFYYLTKSLLLKDLPVTHWARAHGDKVGIRELRLKEELSIGEFLRDTNHTFLGQFEKSQADKKLSISTQIISQKVVTKILRTDYLRIFKGSLVLDPKLAPTGAGRDLASGQGDLSQRHQAFLEFLSP